MSEKNVEEELIAAIQNLNINPIEKIKQLGIEWVTENIVKKTVTVTSPGSIKYLLRGQIESEQSKYIKMGHFGEFLAQELVKASKDHELIGVKNCKSEKKDIQVDIIFANHSQKKIYYFELKGNVELDTEKVKATIDKCKLVNDEFKLKYTEHEIIFGIFNWSIYNRSILKKGDGCLNRIQEIENASVKVQHVQEFIELLNLEWKEEEFYKYFKQLGNILFNNS